MSINLLDWFGYLATIVILISLTMSSIKRLRWINLLGSVMFAIFGAMIGSIPTALLNLGIVVIDSYYLYKIYSQKDDFDVVEAELTSKYFHYYLNENAEGIREQYPSLEFSDGHKAYYFLKNNDTAGILVGRAINKDIFFIDIDYVSERYRDLKIGMHFLGESKINKSLKGYKELRAVAGTKHHLTYLKKLGFKKLAGEEVYTKTI